VLEVGAVVTTGREEHAYGIRLATRRDVVKHVEQVPRVRVHGPNAESFKNPRKGPFQGVSVLQEVGGSGRTAAVVFNLESAVEERIEGAR
jgi:hypothetical protein